MTYRCFGVQTYGKGQILNQTDQVLLDFKDLEIILDHFSLLQKYIADTSLQFKYHQIPINQDL